ncbi:DNA (cytosine-5-)-methyltransferase [Jeotgalicoccus sp. S0W5]|uniref:DNA (cytosine-5-)-methyltransferase n=1 Tax=Jeotgalicoccus sp. S0W5 TaxID=2527874 RepID=UPI001414DE39|nr:DNA (cytosine-5-)-methyltransferase [Jeotgalicoccus sp. S0W5]
MLKVVEAFSGIGSQVEALKNIKIDYEVSATVDWEISAIYTYDILHNGKQNLKDYRLHHKESIVDKLTTYNLSSNGKDPITRRAMMAMPTVQLKSLLAAIERTNNLIDITSVNADQLPNDIDVLTYSFPCQDLSVSSFWHNNFSGITKGVGNRSGLLWEIERLLKDFSNKNKPFPKFLLMENVSAILSRHHIDNFNLWKKFLEDLGYYNQVYTLNSNKFNVAQDRQRTFMISVLCETPIIESNVDHYFSLNNLENVDLLKTKNISDYLRLDYDNNQYLHEAILATPNFTESRKKIMENNRILAVDRLANEHLNAATLTTKQDRNPNSGIIKFEKEVIKTGSQYRNLTPRECFLLMGFKENDFDTIIENDLEVLSGKKFLSNARLYKLTGNSIVVPVLEEIFKQINQINTEILKPTVSILQ